MIVLRTGAAHRRPASAPSLRRPCRPGRPCAPGVAASHALWLCLWPGCHTPHGARIEAQDVPCKAGGATGLSLSAPCPDHDSSCSSASAPTTPYQNPLDGLQHSAAMCLAVPSASRQPAALDSPWRSSGCQADRLQSAANRNSRCDQRPQGWLPPTPPTVLQPYPETLAARIGAAALLFPRRGVRACAMMTA